jgi:hypothetical protein
MFSCGCARIKVILSRIGSFVLPGWCSIEEKLESGEAMETEGCIEVDHSLRVSVVVINSGPLSTHTNGSLERGRTPGTVGWGRTERVESPVSCWPAMSVDWRWPLSRHRSWRWCCNAGEILVGVEPEWSTEANSLVRRLGDRTPRSVAAKSFSAHWKGLSHYWAITVRKRI